MALTQPDLTTQIGPLSLRNPVIAASGTFGYGLELESLVDLNLLGALVVKGLSLKPMPGNPPPRIVETPGGMLNAIGLANIGLDAFLRDKLPGLRNVQHADHRQHLRSPHRGLRRTGFRAQRGVEGVAALEVNISCPNVECGGMAFGIDRFTSAAVTETVVRKHATTGDRETLSQRDGHQNHCKGRGGRRRACAVADQHPDGDGHRHRNQKAETGERFWRAVRSCDQTHCSLHGLSGRQGSEHPCHRMGGIMDYKDAIEFLMVGARAVEIGHRQFRKPQSDRGGDRGD